MKDKCDKCKNSFSNKIGKLHLHWEKVEDKENTEVESRDEYFCSYNCLSNKYY